MTDFSNNGSANGYQNGRLMPPVMDEDVISLREILDMLWQGKWLALPVFALVLGATAVYTFSQEPVYEASSVLQIHTRQAGSAPMGLEQMLAAGAYNRSIQNEIEILKSRSLSRRVARRVMNLGAVPSTGEPPSVLATAEERETPLTVRAVAGRLRSRMRVRQVSRDVDMVRVTASSTVPAEAALIANLYVEEYLQRNQEKSRAEMEASREFLEEQKAKYEKELMQIERKLQAFMEQEQVIALDEKASTLVSQMAQLESLRDETQVELKMAQATLETLRAKANEIEPGLAKRISSGLEQEIASLQEEKAELETQRELIYSKNPQLRENGVTNPTLSEINEQIAALQEQIEIRAQRYVEQVMSSGGIVPAGTGDAGIGSTLGYLTQLQRQITQKAIEVNGYEARLMALAQRINEYQQQFDQIPGNEIRLAQLQRARKANEQIYMFLVEKLQEVRVAEQSELGYAETVDEAIVPHVPVYPDTRRNLMLGAFLGLLTGIGLVFLRNALDNRVQAPEDLKDLNVALAGVIPDLSKAFDGGMVQMNGKKVASNLLSLHNPFAPAVEAYRQLRTNIRFSHPDEEIRTLMVTSPEPGAGKTTTAANLAVVMAQAGQKTVLVDADLRKPRVHEVMGKARGPGLVDLVFDEDTSDLESFATGIDNLYVLPAGTTTPSPSEFLGAQKMDELLMRFREVFDVVIIDSAPLLAVSDSLGLGAKCDATLLVVATNEIDRHAVESSLERLNEVGATIIGAVLNRYHDRSLFGSYYGAYGQYAAYHASTSEVQNSHWKE